MDCKSYQLSAISYRLSAISVRLLMLKYLIGGVIVLGTLPALAQDKPKVSSGQIKQMEQLQKDAEQVGSWDKQYLIIEDATDNIFQKHGWDSEEDRYARELVRNVGRISPWKPQERSKAFMDNLQVRYSLTQDQRDLLNTEMQREAMSVGLKHLKDTLPVAMDVIRTRAKGNPFTAEQVQRWSRKLKPLMDDSLGAVERVTSRLEKTMTQEQREKLDADMKALLKRHHDMEKEVEKWQAGNWNPTDWGLQNDPIHAGAMVAYHASEAEKNARVEEAELKKGVDENKIMTDESAWEKYVRHFCNKYDCTDTQRTTADSILKSCKREAIDYRNARRDVIEKYERLIKSAETENVRQKHAEALERELAPIARGFERLKARLHGEILTTKQHKMFASQSPEKAPE